MQLVVHAPFGARVNRAFGLALRKRFCVSFDFELQAAATDDAIVLSLGAAHSFPLTDAFRFVRADQLDADPAAGRSPGAHVRHALALERVARAGGAALPGGKEGAALPPAHARGRSPRGHLPRAGGLPGQRAGRSDRDPRRTRWCSRRCATASPRPWTSSACAASSGAWSAGTFASTRATPPSRRPSRTRCSTPSRTPSSTTRRSRSGGPARCPCGARSPSSQRDLGALDRRGHRPRRRGGATRAARRRRAARRAAGPRGGAGRGGVGRLAGRAGARGPDGAGGELAFAMENARTFDVLYFGGPRQTLPARLEGAPVLARDEALLAMVRGHAEVCGPFTLRCAGGDASGSRPGRSTWPSRAWRARASVLRGRFTPGGSEQEELCDRRLLARIHRLTLDRLRSEIEPVSAQDFLRYLFDRHRLTRRSRGGGRAGLREAIATLQGFELAAAAWEGEVLAPRVAGYRPEWLDELCLAGEVDVGAPVAAALHVHRARLDVARHAHHPGPRRDLGWLLDAVRGTEEPEAPTSPSAVAALDALRRRGSALPRRSRPRLRALDRGALTDALWDLVGRGLVTGDGFQPLRDLMASGRAARRRGRAVQGRWSMIERAGTHAPVVAPDDDRADRVGGSAPGALWRGLPRARRRARASPSPGARCCARSVAAKRAVCFGVGASWPGSSASSTLWPTRWTACVACAAKSGPARWWRSARSIR